MDPIFTIEEENPDSDKVCQKLMIVRVVKLFKFFRIFLAFSNNFFKNMLKFFYSVTVGMDSGFFNIIKIFVNKAFSAITKGLFVFSVFLRNKFKFFPCDICFGKILLRKIIFF